MPPNVNFGEFTLFCSSCSTAGAAVLSTGGNVFSDLSGITINWAPLVLGPGAVNASFGNFGQTIFSTTVITGLPAPNSGLALPGGVATVQGFVTSTGVPEPATGGIAGMALLGLGFLRGKAKAS